MKFLIAATASAAFLASAASAAVTVIDFDDLTVGTEIFASDLDGISGLSVDSNGSVDSLIIFDTTANGTQDPDLEGPFDNPATAGDDDVVLGNIAIIAEDLDFTDPDDEVRGGSITFDFDLPTTLISADFADTRSGSVQLFSGDILLEAFNLPNVDTNNSTFPNLFTTLFFGEVAGVTRMVINLGESGGFDNLTFSQEVPLPGALPLFLGIAGLYSVRRRK